jgi:glutamine---fructose-6-phosphate transaminase (isomerizing)
MKYNSKMRQEISGIPDTVSKLLDSNNSSLDQLVNLINEQKPHFIITVARGSSDHVALFLKYLIELKLGIPVMTLGPSVVSIYNAKLSLKNALCFAISQSGQSPDILSVVEHANEQGCVTAAITNNPNSPLAEKSKYLISIFAGVEESVAATKTFINSLVVGLLFTAKVNQDQELIHAVRQLPKVLEKATEIKWLQLQEELLNCSEVYTLGRGLSHGVSNEASLKFIETCQIHASSYSSAEVLHGPIELVQENYPVLSFISRDAAEDSIVELCENLAKKKVKVFGTSNKLLKANRLDFIETSHPFTDPISLITSFYAFVESLSILKGRNPDQPESLCKVTKTI